MKTFNRSKYEWVQYIENLDAAPVLKQLFEKIRWSWVWIIPRVYMGWAWLHAGLGKVGNPAWTGENAGAAVTGFVAGALQKTGGEHPDVQAWYGWFLENLVSPNTKVFGYMVAWGEVLVGIGIILGALTGIAAFFGVLMNVNYLLAGTVSTNPVLLLIGLFLILAWRTAGWWGLDRWLLPLVGTLWSPGFLFKKQKNI